MATRAIINRIKETRSLLDSIEKEVNNNQLPAACCLSENLDHKSDEIFRAIWDARKQAGEFAK